MTTMLMGRKGREPARAGLGAPERIVLVDPHGCDELRELLALSGIPVRPVRAWEFGIGEGDRVLSTVPVPAGAKDRVLGIATGDAAEPGVGEVWPDRTLPLAGCEEDVLAYVMDRHAPRAPVVAVWSAGSGLGVSTLAAALARRLAGVPLAVALVDLTGVMDRMLRLGAGLRWPELAADHGPFLPGRMDALLPTWERVRVLTGPGADRAQRDAALFALAASHDLVVVDAGGTAAGVVSAPKDLAIEVRRPESAPMPAQGGVEAISLVRGMSGGAGHGVLPLPSERGLAQAAARGERPGDRTRGSSGRAVRALAELVLDRL